MPLTVVCGPFQPGLEEALIEKLRRYPPGLGRRVALVTPSRRMSERVQRLLALEHGLSFLNLRFHTFHSLAAELVREGGGPEARAALLDDPFHDKAIETLLRAAGGAMTRGLAAAYRATLRDLLEAGIAPAQLREHFPDFFQDPADRAQIEILMTLLERYRAAVSAAGVLPLAELERAAGERARSGSPGLARYAEALYYGFYDLNGVQADFFSAVAQALPTTVFFPYRKDRPAFRFVDRFYQVKLGGASVVHLDPGPAAPAPARTADALFDPGRTAALPPQSLRIVAASGTRDEVWAAVKEILRLRGRGVRFDGIGVTARSLEPYRHDLEQVFRENAIPFSFYAAEPVLRHPLAKAWLSLLTLRRRDYPAETVLDILESPYFQASSAFKKAGGEDGSAALVSWRALIRRQAIHSGWLQWRARVGAWTGRDCPLEPGADDGSGRSVPAAHTRALWSWLEDVHRRLGPAGAEPWSVRAEEACALIRENFALPPDPSDREARIGSTLEKSLRSLAAFDRLTGPVAWDEFLDAAEDRLRRERLEAAPSGRGVRVMDAMDARGDSFQALILLGLNEGRFPRLVREDPLLKDSLRHLLQQPAGYWVLPKLAGYDEEKLLFALLVASARESLTAVYSRADETGRAEVPSVYLRELCRAAGRDPEAAPDERVARQPVKKLLDLPPDLLSPKETSLLLARLGQDPTVFFEAMGWDASLFRDGLSRLDELRRFGEASGVDGLVGRPAAFLRRLAAAGLSPTALDRFALCPFRFFGERVLGLGGEKEPAERGELAPWLKGQIYHAALERFHRRLRDAGYWENPREDWTPHLEAVLNEVFSEFGWERTGLYPVLWESLRRRMEETLRRAVGEDMESLRANGFRPAVFEEPLRAALPLARRGALAGLGLYGRPDRVDVDEARRVFRVIDYKSRLGRPVKLRSLVEQGAAHQPALYLELVAASDRFPGFSPDGTLYYSLEDHPDATGHRMAREFSAADWRDVREKALANVGSYLDMMEEGLFVIVPGPGEGTSHCTHCDLRLACRRNHPPSRWRAENSSARRRLDAVRAGGTEPS